MTISARRYRTITIWALVALTVIIVSGAAVRLTNSGLGCDDWPNCSSERFIDVSSTHAAIEQINRLFTFVVVAAVAAAVLGSFWREGERRRDLTWLSVSLVAGTVANAVLGGITVLVDLHPIAVQGHMLLSMMLIVAATVLVRRASEPDGVPRAPVVSETTRRLTFALFALVCLVIVTGTIVTGAGPHAGDENAERLDIAIPTVARIHGSTVITTLLVALVISMRIRKRPDDRAALVDIMSAWLLVGVLQAALGYVQYFNGVPEILVGLHVAGASAVMIISTLVVLGTSRPVAVDPSTRNETELVSRTRRLSA